MRARADRLLRRAVEEGHVPGVIACATDRSGTTYEGAFGSRVQGEPAGMSPDTVVWLASMTKAITSAAAMQLVERGKLDLDAPARALVPDLGRVRVLEGFDPAGRPRTREPRGDITLRHLLTHTAGFSYAIWSEAVREYTRAMGLPDVTSGRNEALATPLLFDPGERWEYGINIDWAGKLVEAASGRRLGECLRDEVLAPLGMDDTAFLLSPGMRERLARVHRRGADGSLSPDPALEMPQQPEFEAGGHGLYGTARDYLRFVRMMLNEGRSDRGEAILEPGTAARMATNAIGAAKVPPMRTAVPSLSNDAEFFPGIDKRWSLGFMTNDAQAPTGRSAGSLAWAGLANTYYWIDPTRGIGGVLATQILPFADERALRLYYAFERLLYEA